MRVVAEREVVMTWRGPISAFMEDQTRNIDLEGAFRSGKTTACLWKVFNSCLVYSGIQWLVCRYSDGDTQRLLKPLWRRICLEAGVTPTWNPDGHYDQLANGSVVYILGLKAQDEVARYAKLRGLTLGGVYIDQAEELKERDLYDELSARLSQPGVPHQMIISPNPPDENHWIAQLFKEDNSRLGFRHYHVSVFDNGHNLSPETIPDMLTTYPLGHVRHRPAILGMRGLNVRGRAVYGTVDDTRPESAIFRRELHERPLTLNPHLPLCESWDFGKRHPCVVWGQFPPHGGLHLLGGVMGQNMALEDFVPVVERYRAEWFQKPLTVWWCCDPAGSHANSQGLADNAVTFLQRRGINPRFVENSNSPDIRWATIQRIAAHMRRRTALGEAFGVDRDRWYRLSAYEAPIQFRFLADGFQAGYVWDEHPVSVGSKQYDKPKKDGWYEHGQNCTEYLEVNFGGAQLTEEQRVRREARASREELRRAQRDYDPSDRARQPAGMSRGGY